MSNFHKGNKDNSRQNKYYLGTEYIFLQYNLLNLGYVNIIIINDNKYIYSKETSNLDLKKGITNFHFPIKRK